MSGPSPATIARRAPRVTPAVAVAGENSVAARLDDETRSDLWRFVASLDQPTARATASAHNALEADHLVL